MRTCLECGKELTAKRRYAYTTTFCGGACRRVFNNRRATRGAVLYDLTMIAEQEREEGIDLRPGGVSYAPFAEQRIRSLLTQWKIEDGERRRWKPARLVFEDTAYLTVEKVRGS